MRAHVFAHMSMSMHSSLHNKMLLYLKVIIQLHTNDLWGHGYKRRGTKGIGVVNSKAVFPQQLLQAGW